MLEPMKGVKLTPMMQQWLAAKKKHQDAILLFRMGDFYELFGQDAELAAPILELALTSRDKDKSGLKMAGFPHHSSDSYVSKLIEQGHKVAICEQLEDPKNKKGVVKRGVTQVVTPGTLIENEETEIKESNFLVSLTFAKNRFGLAALDLATAEFKVTNSLKENVVVDEISRLRPKELVFLSSDTTSLPLIEKLRNNYLLSNKIRFEEKNNYFLQRQFNESIGNQNYLPSEEKALQLIVAYVEELRGELPEHIHDPKSYSIDEQLLMDHATRENLAILPTKRFCKSNLFFVLNQCKTAMGRRKLMGSLKSPSTSKQEILARQNIVQEFLDHKELRGNFRESLGSIYDIEKLTALCTSKKIGPRGLNRIKICLQNISQIKKLLGDGKTKELSAQAKLLPDTQELLDTLQRALNENAPITLKDGNIFKAGFNKDLEELYELSQGGQSRLIAVETKERKATGIGNLKIKYTRVFGYYIEVTKSQLEKVPSHYQRKQTVANAERYVTPELSQLETELNSASEKMSALEQKLFEELRQRVCEKAKVLMHLARVIAKLDMLCGFAEVAEQYAFIRPTLSDKGNPSVSISAGRHPVVEKLCQEVGAMFVPNEIDLNYDHCSLALITGPNMAGKSTIMRQVALIQVMAQVGSFVPANKADLSICDAIFARVGASDDLSSGRSTFMVEMTETAHILRNATNRSLILLDEIGRGTSTFDGLAIAQSVAEYIHENQCGLVLFATHYHELTRLSERLNRLKNFHVDVCEKGEEIKFLYTLSQGAAEKSFGVQVAKLAGLPKEILSRAEIVLEELEAKNNSDKNMVPTAVIQKTSDSKSQRVPQLEFFSQQVREKRVTDDTKLLKLIRELDINRLTPLQALNKLSHLQSRLRRQL